MNRYLKFSTFCFLLFCFALSSCSIQKRITQNANTSILADSNLATAHIGIAVYNATQKQFVYKHQSNKYFVPASNTKIFSCYAGLKFLGDSLPIVQYAENDTALYLQGTGNPTFLLPEFSSQNFLNFLQSKKSKKIFLSNKGFEANALGFGWSWDDYEETYMPERSFFPMYGNLVTFSATQNGITTSPPFFQNKISKTFEASDGNNSFSVHRLLGLNSFEINPGKNNKPKQLTFSTLQQHNYQSLDLYCDLLGNVLNKQINRVTVPASINFNKKIFSGSTDSMLSVMMHESDNFFAEQTLLMSSLQQLGVMNDEKMIEYLLKNELSGLPQKPKWVDGSGLSRYNLFSPEDFVWMLDKLKTEFSWEKLKAIFPTANEGTLKGLYSNYTNNFFAKTGTLSNHVALSGFFTTKKGNEMIFSVLVNNHQTSASIVRKVVETFISNIIEAE